MGCGFGAVSQEAADCIKGRTDGGGGGRDGLGDHRERMGR